MEAEVTEGGRGPFAVRAEAGVPAPACLIRLDASNLFTPMRPIAFLRQRRGEFASDSHKCCKRPVRKRPQRQAPDCGDIYQALRSMGLRGRPVLLDQFNSGGPVLTLGMGVIAPLHHFVVASGRSRSEPRNPPSTRARSMARRGHRDRSRPQGDSH